MNGIDGGLLATTTLKVIAASTVMAAVAYGVERSLTRVAPATHTIVQAIELASAIGAGVLTLAIVAKLLRMPELDEAFDLMLGRVRKLLGR